MPTPSLPKGGGAIRSIGEKFGVNAVTGTGSLSIPIAVSPGRSGFNPQLALSYDSGAGNGPFGFGWRVDLPSITRKTDQGLPRYRDDEDLDVFVMSGAEDLVPVIDAGGARVVTTRTLHGTRYEVRRYRPRIEGAFARIERWTAADTGVSHFRAITRDNVTTLFGFDADSKIVSPDDPRHVFSYLICRSFDDRGNLVRYRYLADDDIGIDRAQAHEANRSDATRTTQRYIKQIEYGHLTAYFADWSAVGTEPALPSDSHFRVVFDYGDHADYAPKPTPDRPWPVRLDPFSQYRAAFEVRTYRRCQRVLMFHSFEHESGVGSDCLVRSTDFRYSDQDRPTDPRHPIYTFLTSVTQTGYRSDGAAYIARSLPPLEVTYSEPTIKPELVALEAESARDLPEGIDGSRYQWVDLDGEGLSGVLADLGGAWTYKRNLSALGSEARFGPAQLVAHMPSRSDLAGQRLLDLSGDGRLDIVNLEQPVAGFYERTDDRTWSLFSPFSSLPEVPWSEPNLKLLDLTGDGLADAVLSEHGVFTFWPSIGESGFAAPERVPTAWDEQRGPAVVLADGTETVFVADMTGDGLADVVRVRAGEVCYWPNLGYGRFGAKVVMDDAPRLVDEARFDPKRVRLADIDGSGTTDLLYVADDGVHVCFNRSGNSWAAPQRLAVFPSADALSSVQVFDLLGNGTACLVWSSPLPGHAAAPLRYVDLMGGQKPHLMIHSRNNLGSETRVRYAPSTRFYLADELAGRPWVTRLPHVVHVVERVETVDYISRSRFVSRYAYRHGYFDGYEREFRGFGMVEQRDTEEHRDDTEFPDLADDNWDPASWSPPIVTRTWFHTGAFLGASSIAEQYAREYWIEPALRPEARAADRAAMQLSASVVAPGVTLSADELRQAHRALKGAVLRTEVYADDDTAAAAHPYTVTEHNYTVERVQPIGPNEHAVFRTHARETLSFHYERHTEDPRVTHDVTLETDPFGNVKRRVTIGYPRRLGYAAPEPSLAPKFRDMLAYDQARLHIAAVETRYTNDLTDPALSPDVQRTPLPAEAITAEWTGVRPASSRAGITNLFTFGELDQRWGALAGGANDIPYADIPAADVDGVGQPATTPTRRLVEHVRTLYRKDDLSALLALGQLESMALPGESYQLALTADLRTRVFGTSVTDPQLATDGGYVHFDGDDDWWIPSGRLAYSPGDADSAAVELAEARAHFHLPRRAIDAFGAISRIEYAYDMLAAATVDAVGNVVEVVNDYRVLQPQQITDPNGNRSEVAFDALGLVVGTAVMGKVTEALGDSLVGFVADLDAAVVRDHVTNPFVDPAGVVGNASTRLIYDLFAYHRTRNDAEPAPAIIYTLARETHVSDLAAGAATRYQHTFTYGDGLGRELQKKVQAEAGPLVDGGPTVTPRWVGTGWTIVNNKGKPVRKYEPFFSATHGYEHAHQVGVSSVLLYDPADRVVATLHPNSTWEKVLFDAWRVETWDVNDTLLIADPRDDLDVGDRFSRLLGDDPAAWESWYARRINGDLGAREQAAAKKTEAHAGTPNVTHFDSLGRACLSVANNGADGRYPTRTAADAEGKPLAVFDALGRRVFEYCVRELQAGSFRYVAGLDVAGNALYHNGMDGGERRSLSDITGQQIRAWDALGRVFEVRYDKLRRPTHRYVTVGAKKILLDRSIYGDGRKAENLAGRLFRHYDTAGLATNDRFDFKGNLIASTRQLAVEYHEAIDWSALANIDDAAALDLAARPQLVQADRFTATTTYDALSRAIQVITPHSPTMKPNVIRNGFNEANLLERVDVWLQRAAAPTSLLDPTTADLHAVTATEHNARGQRTVLELGNGTITTRDYDPLTFRMTRLTTTRPSTFPADARTVQDLSYFYDPTGNITRIQDDADIHNVVFFRNRRVEPSNDYTYDATYRLSSATGREHLGQAAPQQITDDDSPRSNVLHPGDGNAMATYTETYRYDAVGNILTLTHQVATGGWKRHYSYVEPSQIASMETNNRLTSTNLPNDPDAGPYTAPYKHDAHGNMTRMPHLPRMMWDEQDRLRSTTRQVAAATTPVTTYYTYDGERQRHRKVTDGEGRASQFGTRTAERIYLGPVELHREYDGTGNRVTLERETLHVGDGASRIALVETRTHGSDDGLDELIRYQLTNQIDSAVLEVDDGAEIITYEEYFPYGSTAYHAVRRLTETPKRYRYTGKERDAENGLGYHGARYYASWLGRWTAADPIGIADGENLYRYSQANPVRFHDPRGTDTESPTLPVAKPDIQMDDHVVEGDPKITKAALAGRALSVKGEYEREGKRDSADLWNEVHETLWKESKHEHGMKWLKIAGASHLIAGTTALAGYFAAGATAYAYAGYYEGAALPWHASYVAAAMGGAGSGVGNELAQRLLGKPYSGADYAKQIGVGTLTGVGFAAIGKGITGPRKLDLSGLKDVELPPAPKGVVRLPIIGRHFEPDANAVFQNMVSTVSQQLRLNPSLIQQFLQPGHYRAGTVSTRAARMNYGHAVEEGVARFAEGRFLVNPEQSTMLRGMFLRTSGGGAQVGDFAGLGPHARGMLFDVTTPRGVFSHLTRPYGSRLSFGLYVRPPNFTTFP